MFFARNMWLKNYFVYTSCHRRHISDGEYEINTRYCLSDGLYFFILSVFLLLLLPSFRDVTTEFVATL